MTRPPKPLGEAAQAELARIQGLDEQYAAQNQQLEALHALLERLLADALVHDPWRELDARDRTIQKLVGQAPVYSPGELELALPVPPPLEQFLPAPLAGARRHWPPAQAAYDRAVQAATAWHSETLYRHGAQEAERIRQRTLARQEHERQRSHHERHVALLKQRREPVAALCHSIDEAATQGTREAIVNAMSRALMNSPYPDDFPRRVKVAYVPESKQLVVEADLPGFGVIPEVVAYKYVKARADYVPTIRPLAQRKALYELVLAQIALRSLHELFQADRGSHVDSIVFNGHVETIDPGTGRMVRPCLVTVRSTRETFRELDLSRVDPLACLKVLHAGVSKSPSELAAVRPVLEFSMVDPRFIEGSNVLQELDQRPNLMELTPSEFEALIANLFEKMGLETRQTQASRDGGVDCVAYDPRPILGGKVVIQAKRYKHTVGVSAVRDLFGTVNNEGASKGILVTTSGYGKAAFDFVKGKPLELLSGSHLLYLLEEHAGVHAKIEAPANWHDPLAHAPEG